jgi:hypothetical protein
LKFVYQLTLILITFYALPSTASATSISRQGELKIAAGRNGPAAFGFAEFFGGQRKPGPRCPSG